MHTYTVAVRSGPKLVPPKAIVFERIVVAVQWEQWPYCIYRSSFVMRLLRKIYALYWCVVAIDVEGLVNRNSETDVSWVGNMFAHHDFSEQVRKPSLGWDDIDTNGVKCCAPSLVVAGSEGSTVRARNIRIDHTDAKFNDVADELDGLYGLNRNDNFTNWTGDVQCLVIQGGFKKATI